jgi:hypothetical protein
VRRVLGKLFDADHERDHDHPAPEADQPAEYARNKTDKDAHAVSKYSKYGQP